ncbi:GRAM domain-containing protein 2B isoform X2 [Brienomyrus brachyistius]|uniref:GRAM domain-containing protein 2B isoform X2 n=1 Tax=Brienomyrus brachyistius TaxID=42636 RepID=UPI0020B3D091|nr:GRAM domain-containing protein 2B isoform X2 [Brienomyrus brachyistius]
MLENKRERLKTFLRKIDEKAIFRIKHFMRESYTVEGGGESGGLPVKEKKWKSKRKLELKKAFSLDETQLETQQNKNLTKQVPLRSQTFDSNGSLEKTEGSVTRSSFLKHNKTFHKLFPHIPETEDLIHAFVCALQKEVPYHGRLYVSENHVCFYSSVLLKETKVVIPVSSIHTLKKQNTALLVPNALSIRTNEGEKFSFMSLRNREICFKLLQSVCPQVEELSTSSSLEKSFDHGRLAASSQSSFEDSFDQVDSSALLESSLPSSTQVPYEKSSTEPEHTNMDEDDSTQDLTGAYWVWTVTERVQSLLALRDSSSLSTLLFIYLILVLLLLLSSGYLGLRIVALEEQLTSLGSLSEFSLQSRYKDT